MKPEPKIQKSKILKKPEPMTLKSEVLNKPKPITFGSKVLKSSEAKVKTYLRQNFINKRSAMSLYPTIRKMLKIRESLS